MTIRATVWGENVHERENEVVAGLYPEGMHAAIATALGHAEGIDAGTATLQEPEHGLSEARLAATDVLIWWGHAAHDKVEDRVVRRVVEAVWSGMGFIALHSAHFSKPFKSLMGTACNLSWREAGERERVWTCAPGHPIARGLPAHFELEQEEMYGEPFGIPEPEETVFISWFQGGEVFRSGACWRRGQGRIFYFRPGHETYPTYRNGNVQAVIRNAVRWAHNPEPRATDPTAAPNVPADKAPEPIEIRGPRLHKDGEQGLR